MSGTRRRRPAVSNRVSARTRGRSDGRGSTTVLASVLLVATVVALASVVGAAAFGIVGATDEDSENPISSAESVATPTVLDVRVHGDQFVFVHRGGAPLDVQTLRLVVRVENERLAHQPPVPFFAARGFRAGPTGPFNSATSPRWTAGERASFRVAGTNEPTLQEGARVSVEVYAEGQRVASLETRVGE